MRITVDSHTHTLASEHAYSTLEQNIKAAAEAGLELLCMTDHAPSLPDSPSEFHFINFHVLPKESEGVRVLYGAELNIMDADGTVDLPEHILKRLDICIASYHTMCTPSGTLEENTNAYLRAMENPYVSIIGHPEDGNVPVDFERLVKAAKKNQVLLEVNNSSLKAAYYRKNVRENLLTMLKLCKEENVCISLGSDAHYSGAVGRFDEAEALLKEIRFPEELVASTSADRFLQIIEKKRKAR